MNFSGSLNFNVTFVGNNSIIDVSLLFFFNVLVLCLIARNFACYALTERDRWRKREREKKREGIPNTLRNFFCDDDRTKKNKFHP